MMEKIGGNEVIEVYGTSVGFARSSDMPHQLHYDRQVQDQRARLAFELIRSWGVAAAMPDMVFELHGAAPPPRRPPQEVVMLACELVDAAWQEMTHRGWIVSLPPPPSSGTRDDDR